MLTCEALALLAADRANQQLQHSQACIHNHQHVQPLQLAVANSGDTTSWALTRCGAQRSSHRQASAPPTSIDCGGGGIIAQINLNYMKFNTSSKEIKVEPPYIYQYAVAPRVNTFNPVFDASGNVCGMLWVYNSRDELQLKFTFPSAPDANTYYFASATIIKCPQ